MMFHFSLIITTAAASSRLHGEEYEEEKENQAKAHLIVAALFELIIPSESERGCAARCWEQE
jgi:hypothetical protein